LATRLVQFSVASLDAQSKSINALCALMAVAPPPDWPPDFFDAAVLNWFRSQLLTDPALAPWLGHYIVHECDGRDTLVGTAGYKGPPDAHGAVEIGYAILGAYHRRGIGIAAVAILLAQAFADARVQLVVAETPVENLASRALLQKAGFRCVGGRSDTEDGELALYQIERSDRFTTPS
jgi:[ribosomal protein S5]-alanine N-acetyltransferase